MDIRNGNIFSPEQMEALRRAAPDTVTRYLRPMAVEPTPVQMGRRPWPKVGRNEPCPCGSGLKFKKCCLNQEA